MQPDNAIIGDAQGIDLPQALVNEQDLTKEKNMAKYSKSKEFQDIREYWEGRISFFQTFLPNGTEARFVVPDEKVAQQWVLASNIIVEIKAFLSQYDNAREIVENAGRENK